MHVITSTVVAALTWWGFLWGAQEGIDNSTETASRQLRLNALCHLQYNLWLLSRPHTCAIMLTLPDAPSSWSALRHTPPTLPWPMLPHELLDVKPASITNLEPAERQYVLTLAWEKRSVAILLQKTSSGTSTWARSPLFKRKPQLPAVDHSTLEGQLVRLAGLAADALSDEETWNLARAERLHAVCYDVWDIVPLA
ncbi:hypothetical protein SPI_03376 [Niveomyces insectorum RCEF 264]|uniref:Uncharacterized protein n=1 Tax=Niveomyces insectorum RCEF 264 TaxID=1081102 RepID=A0A167XAK9_9HYPO|nr:hypothetical protein SPI_03376 [Niveomyces insectorum RCEF 264]